MTWEATMHNFITLFAGRLDVYGGWEGFQTKLANPCVEPMKEHLHHGPYIGVYCIDVDNHTRWGCIDIDGKDFASPDQGHDWDRMWTLAALLQDVLNYKDITSWLERTKNGIHVWVFAEVPVLAATMRRALMVACEVADYKPKEVNPKAEGVGFVHEYHCPNGPLLASRSPGGRRLLQHPSPEEEGQPDSAHEAGDDGPGRRTASDVGGWSGDTAWPVSGAAWNEAALGVGGSPQGGRDRPTGAASSLDGRATTGADQRMPGCGSGCRETGTAFGNFVRLPYYGALVNGTPPDRFVVDEDGRPMDVHEFSRSALGSRNPVALLEALADLYVPPSPKVTLELSAATHEQFTLLEPLLPPLVKVIFEEGPLNGDRSGALVKTAILLRNDGWRAQAAFTVLMALDERLGKFVGRPDREEQLLKIIEKVEMPS